MRTGEFTLGEDPTSFFQYLSLSWALPILNDGAIIAYYDFWDTGKILSFPRLEEWLQRKAKLCWWLFFLLKINWKNITWCCSLKLLCRDCMFNLGNSSTLPLLSPLLREISSLAFFFVLSKSGYLFDNISSYQISSCKSLHVLSLEHIHC